jgi:hypothetical protein
LCFNFCNFDEISSAADGDVILRRGIIDGELDLASQSSNPSNAQPNPSSMYPMGVFLNPNLSA